MAAPAPRQLRLLLWKDFLIRKRKLVTLAGILWATAVMLSLYIVRANVDNPHFPTCQFPARALPSAGLLTFLQSFLCSVNNDCSPLDDYEQIPAYSSSKLTQLQGQFAPLLYNESVLEVAATVPHALKLLATLSDVVDEPSFVDISKNGLRFGDLFTNADRVRRYLSSRLDISDDVTHSVMNATLSFQGIMKGDVDKCSITSMSETLLVDNTEHLDVFVQKLCALSDKDVQKILMDLLIEVNFSKYIGMLGNMYFKLSGDDRITQLASTITAVLRMSQLQSFLPLEVSRIIQSREVDFSYFDLNLISKLMYLFEPTFGDTEAYKSIREFTDTAVIGLRYLSRFITKESDNPKEKVTSALSTDVVGKTVTKTFNNAVEVLEEISDDMTVDVFNILSKLTNFIYKWLPKKLKQDVLFYSTLLTKLIESANHVLNTNMHIEERAYNVSLRHPDGVQVLVGLTSQLIGKGFEALADAERTQIVTSKINTPGQMFCDTYRIQGFFKVSPTEASSLKTKLCTDAWRNYVTDLIQSFGIYEVKDNINAMASIVIQDTLGKDVSESLYTLDYDFMVLKNFSQALDRISHIERPKVDWNKLFNETDDSEFMKTIRSKGQLGKQMLIIVHGALAKEVVKQNILLNLKITPALVDTTTLVTAINRQLDTVPQDLVGRVKEMYPDILRMVLETALDEDKTYKSLSTYSVDMMCSGAENASSYLQLPRDSDWDRLVATLCDISVAIEDGFKRDSFFGKAIETVMSKQGYSEVRWTALITGLKDLYVKLDRDYPYLFEYSTYGMDESARALVQSLAEKGKTFWFGKDSLGRSLRLSIKLGFRLLDLMDSDIFNMTSEGWLRMRHGLGSISGPLAVLDEIFKVVAALSRNESYSSTLPPRTLVALDSIIPNLPQLVVDAAEIIVKDDSDIEPIISILNAEPPWPCSSASLAELLPLAPGSRDAIRALEQVWCMDDDFRHEWTQYLDERNITMFDPKQWNSTTPGGHVFLKFSKTFDAFIEDMSLLKQVLETMRNSSGVEGRVSWGAAWDSVAAIFNRTDRDTIMQHLFTKLDTVLTAVNTSGGPAALPLGALWADYGACSSAPRAADRCRTAGRAAWKHSLQFFSVMFEHAADDILTYLTEINEPNATLLQLAGFTRNTTLHQLYDKLPDFVAVLVNSYTDYGFMSQIRRASLSQFWDCEAVVNALVPAPGSRVDGAAVRGARAYVCPSLLHWLSLPRGDNTLLDVIAKPQYFLYTLEVQNLTSNYKEAYNKMTELANFISETAKKNKTILSKNDIEMGSLQGKLEYVVDIVLNYKLNESDPSYRLFNEINLKQYMSAVYLIRVVAIINKLATAIEKFDINEVLDVSGDEMKKVEADLTAIQKTFKRRPNEAIASHFDIITQIVWKNDDKNKLINALDTICERLKSKDTTKDILIDNQRVKSLICSKRYQAIYGSIEKYIEDDYESARNSLLNLVRTLQNGELDNVTDVAVFLNKRKQLMDYLRNSIRYSYDLSLPTYLQYLQSNLQHYQVILAFLSGGDWWGELRGLYRGHYAKSFLDSMEKSFDVAEDVLTNLDKIHLVRLLRDVDVNNSDAFCQPGVTLSDYVPDGTGALSDLKRQICVADKADLFKELPPLLFASQGYENLRLPKDIDYTALDADIAKTEAELELVRFGPSSPQRPPWVTEDKVTHLREVVLRLLSKESLIKISFGLLHNLVDAGTLFLNNSQCSLCSQLTSWFKQLNLQLVKKQEYDTLLCQLRELTLQEVHGALKNNFHWDMAIRELILPRNYTKYELNKSLGEFLELVKLHALEGPHAIAKLADCLARNATRNAFGNATLFVTVLSHTLRLVRAELPHLHEVEGLVELPYFKQLSTQVARHLDVERPLMEYLNRNDFTQDLVKVVEDMGVVGDIVNGRLSLRLIRDEVQPVSQYLKIQVGNWDDICETHDCHEIDSVIRKSVDTTSIDKQLPNLQAREFWRFAFVANILEHTESLLSHGAGLLAVASGMDIQGVLEGRLAAVLDLLMQVLSVDTLNAILYSVQGIVTELHPLLQGTDLEHDLKALASGLTVMQQFKNHLLENEDLRVQVSKYFSSPRRVQSALNEVGVNSTRFWAVAAPRVHAGHIDIKPIFATKDEYHISDFVCRIEDMSKIIIPSLAETGMETMDYQSQDMASLDDVYAATSEQFCGLGDEKAKQIVPVLMQNLNFSVVMEKITDMILTQLYSASNLTQAEGAAVLERLPRMAALLPVVQGSVGDLTETISKEPLIQSLKDFSSVGGLLASPEFLAGAGNMLCGKPFQTDQNRFYKAITKSQDFSNEPDQEQLDVLPTDFCRSLYKDIVGMEGGKIVWSFVKPLIMGKILYTPASPAVERIIEQVNSTFAHMIKLTDLVHSFAHSFSSLDRLAAHRAGVAALRRLVAAPALAQLRAALLGDAAVPDVDIDTLFDQFGDIQGIGSVLKKVSQLLQCINLNRFRAARDEQRLMHEAAALSRVNEFSAGLVFLKSEIKANGATDVEYKIRMDIENSPTTTRTKNYLWIPGPESSFIEHMRYFRGFIQIQDLVDKAIIQLSRSTTRVQKRDTRTDDVDNWAVYTQQEPYPCYRKDFFQTSLYESQALIVAFFFSLLFTVSSAVRFIVADKETGNTMLMSVMGVDLTYHTLSWFAVSLAEMLLTCACVAAVLCGGGILPNTDPSMVFVLLLVFGFSVLSFCYMMSKLFSSASSAAVCTGIAYLATFMPFVMILSLEAVLTSSLKLFVCLSMSSAICYSFLCITRYEAMGRAAGWGDVWRSPGDTGDMSIAVGALMALADAAIYIAIGYLIDRYFGPKTLQSNITNCVTTGEKAGVSIVNVSKVYGEGSRRPKVALDNVSIELHKGQITTLLGHNGAGKTTLINILTGMLKPSSGHVTVRSERAGGTRVGVCPQRDVLFDCMSASEHVALYAQLKSGRALRDVADEVQSMLSVLSLGEVAHEPAARLSGGTRRRLCVALAFIARPRLVSLDEPTAGVDPAARRDIWSMIVKLREDRTILLTTHHLDEAELLSDQIVIMHRGRIHTIGSPIEIKRSLGDGYKLTVVYPARGAAPWAAEDPEEPGVEERTKQLLAVARDAVQNASLLDVNGLEVEVALPFFDATGLNSNFLQLCTALESRQMELGFSSYSLDCSSLEQVFFNICQRADAPADGIQYELDTPSKSASTSSVRSDQTPLVPAEGPLRGSPWRQFLALLHARYIHYTRNRWLLFLLIVLPSLFVATAMGFSMIRPPADNEVSLRLHPDLYADTTQYLVPSPSVDVDVDPSFAQRVMDTLRFSKRARNWTAQDTPNCKCTETRQECELHASSFQRPPEMMLLPDVDTLNRWLVGSHEVYTEKRYGGFSSCAGSNATQLVVWYNNKGHHAMPAFLNALNTALLRAASGDSRAAITVYSHPLKISKEQLSKDTVYQHIADAGISALVLIAYSLVSGGAAVYLVGARCSQEKRLQLLCGVTPALYWAAALAADMTIIVINMVITVVVFEAFGFPVFVARNNLPAICILILLYGYACGSVVHVAEKLFSEASLANMMLFCGNAFVGLVGITVLLILDIISESDWTDNVRWSLHKVLLLCPQFVLGDGLLEIAKNTVQAQVLQRFGMDTYKDPLSSSLIAYHYVALVLVGTATLLLNLAIEYGCFEGILDRFRPESVPERAPGEMEDLGVSAERQRVHAALARRAEHPVRLQTIGNINAGFVDTEVKKNSIKRIISPASDVAQCVELSKSYPTVRGRRVAVSSLTLGIPPGQCTALLGENGAGKSTTFSMLTGEVRPSAGQLYLNEERVDSRRLCRGLASYCPQSDAVDPLMSARETLELYCRLRGIEEQDKVIERALEMFDLTKYADVRSGALSGGNKRKLCAAVAFAGRAPLVLLDEPTSGMDPASRACVVRGVRMACAGARGVLLSTHALDDARRLAARVALVRAGELCALASLDDCLRRFGGGYVVACRVAGGGARAAWRRVRAAAPHAALRVLHHAALHFLLPTHAAVDQKEITTSLSDVFRLMAELQGACDIEDYTVNQSSLDQMFLSFTDKAEVSDDVDLETLPSPRALRRRRDPAPAPAPEPDALDTVTSL